MHRLLIQTAAPGLAALLGLLGGRWAGPLLLGTPLQASRARRLLARLLLGLSLGPRPAESLLHFLQVC